MGIGSVGSSLRGDRFQAAGGVGGLLSIHEASGNGSAKAGQTLYPTFDGNGNITRIIDSSSNVVCSYGYDPFGNFKNPTGNDADSSGYTAEQPFGFSTNYRDTETGLYYYGYRYYDPVTGRWPSRDPIGENGGENLYGFAYNNSLYWYDFIGLDPKPVDGGFGFDWPGQEDHFRKQSGNPKGDEGETPGVGHGKTGKDMLDHLVKLSADNCCIRKLTLASHGGKHGLGGAVPKIGGFVDDVNATAQEKADFRNQIEASLNNGVYPKPGDKNYHDPKDFIDKGARDLSHLSKMMDAGKINFCKKCVICIFGCGQELLPAKLAKLTKCHVVASTSKNCWATNGVSGGTWTGKFKRFMPDGTTKDIGGIFDPHAADPHVDTK